jgi:molybdopterin-containing oxidoreductase family membrane subunit
VVCVLADAVPEHHGIWPQFKSPLTWDVAVATYFTISLLFWFLGLVPDSGAARFIPEEESASVYGMLAMAYTSGRTGPSTSGRTLAGLSITGAPSTPSFVDFAVLSSGWHTTMSPRTSSPVPCSRASQWS